MALNLGGLNAFLALDIQPFLQGIQQASQAASQLGKQLQQAVGEGVQNGLNNSTNATKGLSSAFKDVKRIVSGILISQTFYSATNSIQDAVLAVQNFSMEMEVAQKSFERLLGTQDQARGFLAVLQDFAAVTPFTVGQTLEMSRRMMAMGFEANSLKNVLNIITDATAALGGDAQKFDRIVLALGQIKTNGKLAGQEIRQLGEAGINAREILSQELGLTKDQLMDIGDLDIDGDTAVTAILKGLEKRFKGMNEVIANTTQGMLSTIKDDILLIGDELNKGFFGVFSGVVRKLRDSLETIRKSMREGGLGKVFKDLVPPELQTSIKSIISAFQSLGRSLKMLAQMAGIVFQALGETVVRALGIILPPIVAVIENIVRLMYTAMKTSPWVKALGIAIIGLLVANTAAKAVMVLWRIISLGSLCTAVGSAVKFLTSTVRALTLVLTRNPIIAIIMVLSGALLSLALSSKTVSNALDGVIKKLTTLSGLDTDAVFKMAETEDYNKLMEEFNKQYEGLNSNLKDVGKTAEKSGKKVKDKFLASFDEVYTVPDQLDDLGDSLGGSLGDIPNIKFPDFGNQLAKINEELDKLAERENDDDFLFPARANQDLGGRIKFPPPDMGSAVATVTEGFKQMLVAAEGQLKGIRDKLIEAVSNWKSVVQGAPIQIPLVWGTIPAFPALPALNAIVLPITYGAVPPFPALPPTPKPADIIIGMQLQWQPALEQVKKFFTETLPKEVPLYAAVFAVKLAAEAYQLGNKFVTNFVTPALQGVKDFFTVTLPKQVPLYIAAFAVKLYVQATTLGGKFADNFIMPALTGIQKFFTVTLPNWLSQNGMTILTGTLLALGALIVAVLLAPVELAAGATGAISIAFAAVVGAIMTALAFLGPKIMKWWKDDIKEPLGKEWDEFATWSGEKWTKVTDAISNVLGTWNSKIVEKFGEVKTGIKGIIKDVIELVNKMINKLNSVSIKLPEVNVPGLGKVGGTTFGFSIPPLEIPGLRDGGIVTRDSLIRAGEGNRSEAVVPLNNPSALAPFIEALVEGLQTSGNGGRNINYYTIGTLIGDERSLKELERRLNAIRLLESQRTGAIMSGI